MSTFLQTVEGFTPVIDVVVKDIGLMPALVYSRMWRYCQMHDGVCRASLDTVVEYLGISARTVRRHAQVLCETGYLDDLTPDCMNRPHAYVTTDKVIVSNSSLLGQLKQFFIDDPWPCALKKHRGRKAIIPNSVRKAVFERDAYRCQHCGDWHQLTVDHIYPESKGGKLAPDNLQTLCNTCNQKKGAIVPDVQASTDTNS